MPSTQGMSSNATSGIEWIAERVNEQMSECVGSKKGFNKDYYWTGEGASKPYGCWHEGLLRKTGILKCPLNTIDCCFPRVNSSCCFPLLGRSTKCTSCMLGHLWQQRGEDDSTPRPTGWKWSKDFLGNQHSRITAPDSYSKHLTLLTPVCHWKCAEFEL